MKMKQTGKLLSLLLVLVMVLSALPVNILATGETGNESTDVAEIGGVGYETLAEAVAEAVSGDIVKLLANNTETVTVDLTKGYTLDFNNFYAIGATIITNGENWGVSVNNEILIAEMQENLPNGYILKYNDTDWNGEYTVTTGNYAAETVFFKRNDRKVCKPRRCCFLRCSS